MTEGDEGVLDLDTPGILGNLRSISGSGGSPHPATTGVGLTSATPSPPLNWAVHAEPVPELERSNQRRFAAGRGFRFTQAVAGPEAGHYPCPVIGRSGRSPPFNMTDQQLEAIRRSGENQAKIQIAAREALGPIVGLLVPEYIVPKIAGKALEQGIDLYNNSSALTDEQKIRNASDQAMFDALNNSMAQQWGGRSIWYRRS